MHRLLHDHPQCLILLLEQLLLVFNQMLSIGSFGGREDLIGRVQRHHLLALPAPFRFSTHLQ